MQNKYKKYFSKKYKIIYSALTTSVLVVIFVIFFCPTKEIPFSYAATTTCVPQVTLLPGMYRTHNESSAFAVELRGKSWLYATDICIQLKGAPKKGRESMTISPFGWYILRHQFILATPHVPVADVSRFDDPLSISKPLTIPLDKVDKVFRYSLAVGKKQAKCDTDEKDIVCRIAPLELQQGKNYPAQLTRSYGDYTETLVNQSIATLKAVSMQKSSITPDAMLYKKSKSFTITMNKQIISAEGGLYLVTGKKATKVEATLSVKDKEVIVAAKKDLTRGASYQIKITSVQAKDGSGLDKVLSIPFKTSNGPVPVSYQPQSTISTNGTITITFDQSILPNQNISKLVSVKGAKFSAYATDQQIVITLLGAPACSNVTVVIGKGLQSGYGVPSRTESTKTLRTYCYTVSTIGHTVQGRAINAYYFGSGTKTILFTGAIHGNEKSTKYTMDSFIAYLDTIAKQIPPDKQVVVVPLVNPDGFYATGRYNAHNVNLNRNWPVSSWVSDKGVGGKKPYTEPEVKTLGALTERLQPAFVATYHSQGGIVNSNDVGSSISLGRSYASAVGYRYVSDADTVSVLGGTVTGTYEDWLKERGVPCILMELGSDYGDFFPYHKNAIWNMIKSY